MTRLLACAFCAVFSLLAPLAPALADQVADGKSAFTRACRTCHLVREGENRMGPTLYGVVGRKAGTVPGFVFSPAMQNSGIVWDEVTLDKFITDPAAVVHGHKMQPFGGIDSAEQRSQIIAYLKSIGGK